METIVSRTLSVHQEHELLGSLERAGLTGSLAQKVIDSQGNDLAGKLVRLIVNGGFEATTSHKRAREIMGRNFFGIEEAIQHFGVNPKRQELATLAEVPFTEQVLEACKETHVLVAVFPMSILDIRGKLTDKGLFYNQDWYNKQAFAKDRGEAGWHLVRKTPVENSMSKTWDEQLSLLGPEDETPTARVVTYTIIGHFLATGERLFEKVYVRCVDVDSHSDRVYVGRFSSDGLDVNYFWDSDRYYRVGLSSSRKSD